MVKWRYQLVLWALFVWVGFVDFTAQGAAAPSPMAWYDDLMQKGPTAGEYIHRLLIVEGLAEGHLKVRPMEGNISKMSSYFELMDERETRYLTLFNPAGGKPEAKQPLNIKLDQALAEVFASTYADTIIHAPIDDERWTIYRVDKVGAVKREFIIKGPTKVSGDEITKWLLDKLGYTGIVLDRLEDYLLVATYKPLKETDSAMLVVDSADKLRVKKSQMSGGALLKRFDCWQSICVFKILIDSNKAFPAGTKVFF